MAVWKQILGVIVVAVLALAGWAALVPSSHPYLDRWGLLKPLQTIGIASAPSDADAADAGGAGGSAGGGSRGPVRVVAEPVALREMNDRVAAIGTAQGARSVTLASEIAGIVSEVRVRSGEYVDAGTVLVQLNDEAARIARDRADLLHENEVRNLDRLERLKASGSVTDIQLQDARLAEQSAALAMREAEFELSRHRIVAPVPGWIGIIEIEPGDLLSAGTRITEVEDRSSLIVDFRVPERVASLLKIGDAVEASSLANKAVADRGQITALDNKVDETSRTLRVQATIPNDDDRLRPGMAITLAIDLPGEEKPAVDPLSIQWGSDGAYVWLLREGKAMRLPVQLLERNTDSVLVEGDFREGDLVVSEGMTVLRPGAEAVAVEANARAVSAGTKG